MEVAGEGECCLQVPFRLVELELNMARLIYTLARKAGIRPEHAREMVSASWGESTLDPRQVAKSTGAIGLFQLLGPYLKRARRYGDPFNPRINVCAIIPNYLDYWLTHEGAGPGECAATVENSGATAAYYAQALAWLPRTFKLINIKACPRLKPVCGSYFTGTKFAGPPKNCTLTG